MPGGGVLVKEVLQLGDRRCDERFKKVALGAEVVVERSLGEAEAISDLLQPDRARRRGEPGRARLG